MIIEKAGYRFSLLENDVFNVAKHTPYGEVSPYFTTTTTCTCLGYKYRRYCKHMTYVKQLLTPTQFKTIAITQLLSKVYKILAADIVLPLEMDKTFCLAKGEGGETLSLLFAVICDSFDELLIDDYPERVLGREFTESGYVSMSVTKQEEGIRVAVL